MKFRFIEQHRGAHSVAKMARMLGVTRGGYYAWRRRARSERSRQEEHIVKDIKAIQEQMKYRYGSPRVHRELRRRGIRVGHNRVAALMRLNRLGARRRKRYRSTTDSGHNLPVAENLLNRGFEVAAANTLPTFRVTRASVFPEAVTNSTSSPSGHILEPLRIDHLVEAHAREDQ